MFKKYYNSMDERELQNHSAAVFEEISSGVYQVVKDRHLELGRFVTADTIVSFLNKGSIKITIKGSNGIYANFDLEEFRFNK